MHRAYPLALAGTLALFAAGCGGSKATVLDAGLCSRLGTHCTTVTPDAAVRDVSAARKQWLGEVRANAVGGSARRFPNVARPEFARRLTSASRRYHFAVESITWRDGGAQDVPDVVLESSRYAALASELPSVLDAVDPPPRSNRRAFEAIFIEAVDPRHVPFVAVFDSLRGHVMGGQWARSEALFPYAHG